MYSVLCAVALLLWPVSPGAHAQTPRQNRQQQMLLPQSAGRGQAARDSSGGSGAEGVQEADRREAGTLLSAVEEGLGAGDISRIARHLASSVSLNLRDAESGTFSGNQAYYVLESYLKGRRLVGLTLSPVLEGESPYGTGPAMLHARGGRDEVQVFVALRRFGGRFVITQITIH